jgi:hypothetical protein
VRKMSGGCLCGQVRYSASADPAMVAVCHCRNCQKQAGTAAGLCTIAQVMKVEM